MPFKCIVHGCRNGEKSGVSLHRVPSCKLDLELRKKWLSNCGRMDLLFKKCKHVVCSKHFTASCLKKNLQVELMENRLQYDLIRGSVPTLFQNSKWTVFDETVFYENTNRPELDVTELLYASPLVEFPHEADPWLESTHTSFVSPVMENSEPEETRARPLQDITNVAQNPTPSNKRHKVCYKDCGTQTDSPEMRTMCVQTEENPQASIVLKDHCYVKRPLTSTPGKSHPEKLECELSLIDTDQTFEVVIDTDETLLVAQTNEEIPSNNVMAISTSGSESSETYLKDSDTDYIPLSSDSSISSQSSSDSEVGINEKTFIVYGSSLECLFSQVRCTICGQLAMKTDTSVRGTLLSVHFQCINFHDFRWDSQPQSGLMPVGNILAAGAVLCSGLSFTAAKLFMSLMNMKFIHKSAYSDIQKAILFPVINSVYTQHQNKVLNCLAGASVVVAGDGRCDSPGFCAKYGTYTLMDINTNMIIDFHITQCTEAGNSVKMEKYGLEQCLSNMKNKNVKIDAIATDRHVQIRHYLKTEHKDIDHQFDVWHLGKSIGKKISNKSKQKGYEKLSKWRKSVVNHLWWTCATCDGDPDLLVEKWISIIHHVTNKHIFPGNFYTSCEHGNLDSQDRKTKWMKINSREHIALKEIVMNKGLIKDLRQCTRFLHTGALESYHSMMLKYCPKRIHYSLEGMKHRTQLAVLDNNMNCNRAQATIKRGPRKGEPRFRTECPKMSKEWVAKKIYEPKDFSFLHEIVDNAIKSKQENKIPEGTELRKLPKNIAPTPKPQKAEIVEKHVSRFCKK